MIQICLAPLHFTEYAYYNWFTEGMFNISFVRNTSFQMLCYEIQRVFHIWLAILGVAHSISQHVKFRPRRPLSVHSPYQICFGGCSFWILVLHLTKSYLDKYKSPHISNINTNTHSDLFFLEALLILLSAFLYRSLYSSSKAARSA